VDELQPRYTRAADGTHIAYAVMGDGPVDLVYSFGYQSNIDADGDVPFHAAFRRRLAAFSRLILYDRRGTGLSDRSALRDAGALEAGMDDVRAVMDAVDSERALMYGSHDGAALAALFAASHPDRTLGLVLWAPEPRGLRSDDFPWGWTRERYDESIEKIERSWGTIEFAVDNLSSQAPGVSFDQPTLEKLARMFRSVSSPGEAVAVTKIMRDSDVRAILPAIAVPTLVLQSADDPEVEVGRYTATLIPGAAFVEIPGADGLPLWTHPDLAVAEIERFVKRIRYEEAILDRSLATILFTDIVGSTTLASERGDRAWSDLLERHHGLVRAMLRRYRGNEVDTAGDGFFATFDGPVRGVRCAQAIVEGVRPLGLEIRAGLHTGEVELTGGTVRGLAVHIGARIGALAGANEVLVSRTVRDLVAGSGLRFESLGERDLKGIDDPWHLYRLDHHDPDDPVA